MKRILLSSILSVSLYGESLDELINIAIKNNTTIKQSQINVDTKKQSQIQSESLYLPTLSLEADISKYDIETAGVKTDGNAKSISVSASQLLYDFGKSSHKIEASKQNLTASKKELNATSANIILNVTKVYYDILNKLALINVAEESVKIDEFQLYQAKEYFKAKIKTKIDVTNAKLQLSNSKMKLIKANFDVKKAKVQLISLLSKQDIIVENMNQDIKNLVKEIQKDTYDLENLIAQAMKNRDELLMYTHLEKALHSNYESSKSDFYPKVNLVGSYQDSSSDDISSLDTNQFTAGVYLKWELFSGFRTQASKKEALNELQNLKEQQKEQELSIIENVTNAYFNVEQNKQSIEISLLNNELAQQNLELAQERYKNGLNSLLELNDAKLDFINAKTDLVNQYYGYKTSQAVLKYEIGTIN